MIENLYPFFIRTPIVTLGTHLKPAGFEIQDPPAKYVLSPSRFRLGSYDLGLMAEACLIGDTELLLLLSKPRRNGYALLDQNAIVLKRENPVSEMHELIHLWQNQKNLPFIDTKFEVCGTKPMAEKLLINHIVCEGVAEWSSLALALSSRAAGQQAASEKLAFLEQNRERRFDNVREVVSDFPTNLKPLQFRLAHFRYAVKRMDYDAYSAGLFYVNSRMRTQLNQGNSIPGGLREIMQDYPECIDEVLIQARQAPELIRIIP